MEKKIEKHRFYISKFQEKAAWMGFVLREKWRSISTDGFKNEVKKGKEKIVFINWTLKKMVLQRKSISKYSRIGDGNM